MKKPTMATKRKKVTSSSKLETILPMASTLVVSTPMVSTLMASTLMASVLMFSILMVALGKVSVKSRLGSW